MDQNNCSFKVIEIEEEEPDFSVAEKENLLSFDAAIREELENEGWLQSRDRQEETAENIPISEEAEEQEMNPEDRSSEPERSADESQPHTVPDTVPNIEPEKPAVSAVTDISAISDKLAFIMGLIPEQKIETASELAPEQHSPAETEVTAEEVISEPVSESESEAKSEIESESDAESDIAVQTGPVDDDFYRYFGDFKFTENGIPADIILLPEEETRDYDQISGQEAESVSIQKNERKNKSILRGIFSWVLTLVVAFVIAMSINIYLFRPSEVSGPSMMPTLQNGDTVILSRVPYIIGEPQRGDIVVIDSDVNKKRNTWTLFSEALEYNIITKLMGHSEPDYFWIKRVVGVAGDTISFQANRIYRNGEELHETYINEQDVYTYRNGTSYTIEEGYVFVMGDNRNHSTDSRVIGPVPIDNIIGKMIADW